MQPIDTKSGKLWSTTVSNAAHRHIRAGCLTDLRRRDAGHGIGPDGKVYAEPDGVDPDTPGRYVIDEAKAKAKHTGGEFLALLRSRWATFCSKPQDEAAFAEEHRVVDRTQETERFNVAASGIEASLKSEKSEKQGLSQTYKKARTSNGAVT